MQITDKRIPKEMLKMLLALRQQIRIRQSYLKEIGGLK